MQDKLELEQGEKLHLFTNSGGHVSVVVMSVDGDKAACLFSSGEKGAGTVFLYWDGKDQTYHSHPTGYELRVERPVFVSARLIRNTTSDGIMEIEAPIGKRYKLDMISIQDQDWGHVDHPGKGVGAQGRSAYCGRRRRSWVLPLELFEIEAN